MPWMTLEYEVTMRFIADIEYAKVIHRITFCYRLQISNRLPGNDSFLIAMDGRSHAAADHERF